MSWRAQILDVYRQLIATMSMRISVVRVSPASNLRTVCCAAKPESTEELADQLFTGAPFFRNLIEIGIVPPGGLRVAIELWPTMYHPVSTNWIAPIVVLAITWPGVLSNVMDVYITDVFWIGEATSVIDGLDMRAASGRTSSWDALS